MKIGLLLWEVVTLTVIVFGALCVFLLRSWFSRTDGEVRWGIVAAVQRGAVGSVGDRLGRRYSPFAVWIWLVPARAGNNGLRREEICTEIVGMGAIITLQEITLTR